MCYYRCLIACLKFLGAHPCPDCLVKKEDIWKMGMKHDLATRVKKARVDDPQTRSWFARIRNWIFCNGDGPDSTSVKNCVTSKMSLNATQVRIRPGRAERTLTYRTRARFRCVWPNARSTTSNSSCRILCTSLIWASGRLRSHTLYAFSSRPALMPCRSSTDGERSSWCSLCT